MSVAEKGVAPTPTTSIINDERYRSVFYQLIVFGLVAYGAYFLITNTATNLETRGMNFGYDFLKGTAGFSIAVSSSREPRRLVFTTTRITP